jgi:hypothetical protein
MSCIFEILIMYYSNVCNKYMDMLCTRDFTFQCSAQGILLSTIHPNLYTKLPIKIKILNNPSHLHFKLYVVHLRVFKDSVTRPSVPLLQNKVQ